MIGEKDRAVMKACQALLKLLAEDDWSQVDIVDIARELRELAWMLDPSDHREMP